jgi:RNA polymerase II subunit A-like phosphatase
LSDTDYCYSIDIAEIEEPCSHSVQFGGLCSLCGKDMTEYVCGFFVTPLALSLVMADGYCRVTYNTDFADAERATINMIHDNMDLTVSADVRIMVS